MAGGGNANQRQLGDACFNYQCAANVLGTCATIGMPVDRPLIHPLLPYPLLSLTFSAFHLPLLVICACLLHGVFSRPLSTHGGSRYLTGWKAYLDGVYEHVEPISPATRPYISASAHVSARTHFWAFFLAILS